MVISFSDSGVAASQSLVLMFGGTFDPIHNGHLRCALELTQVLPVCQVRLVPCQIPPHRERPGATAEQRLAMLQLAIAGETALQVDDRELRRPGPSWSVDTLMSLRQEYGASQPLAMVLGWDAFLGLPNWSRREALLELAHLIVLARPGQDREADPVLSKLLEQHELKQGESLNATPAGRILRLSLPSAMQISATYIRRLLARQASVRYLLPDEVIEFIRTRQLYR